MKLKMGIDYTVDEKGNVVLSKEFLLSQECCCKNSHPCQNCPYRNNDKQRDEKQIIVVEEEENDQ